MLQTKPKLTAVLTVLGLFVALVTLIIKPATGSANAMTQGQSTAVATADQNLSSYKLASIDDLDLSITGALYLSPDGQRIAQTGGKGICLYSAAGAKQVCTDPYDVDQNSLRWSPDSRYIAFTENFFMFFRNPDIRLIDMDGNLTDLTDDHGAKLNITRSNDPNVHIDVAPTWFPDGKRILFIRYTATNNAWVAVLYSIDLAGADLKQEGSLSAYGFSTTVLALSPDGEKLAYNFSFGDRKEVKNGLWVSDLSGGNAKQLIQATLGALDPKTYRPGLPLDMAYSANGRYLLIFDSTLLSVAGAEGSVTSRVTAVDGTNTLPVDTDDNARFATWAPSGTALAYAVVDAKNADNSGLYVTTKPGDPGQLLYKGTVLSAGGSWRALSWAANNTILIKRTGGGAKTPVALLHLLAQ